ncbi:hypothetical protein INR49_006521, partial [Caranx melampygus]
MKGCGPSPETKEAKPKKCCFSLLVAVSAKGAVTRVRFRSGQYLSRSRVSKVAKGLSVFAGNYQSDAMRVSSGAHRLSAEELDDMLERKRGTRTQIHITISWRRRSALPVLSSRLKSAKLKDLFHPTAEQQAAVLYGEYQENQGGSGRREATRLLTERQIKNMATITAAMEDAARTWPPWPKRIPRAPPARLSQQAEEQGSVQHGGRGWRRADGRARPHVLFEEEALLL